MKVYTYLLWNKFTRAYDLIQGNKKFSIIEELLEDEVVSKFLSLENKEIYEQIMFQETSPDYCRAKHGVQFWCPQFKEK